MSTHEATFWLGKGVCLIGGDKFKTGDEIPIERVPKKTREKWEAEGLIGNAPIKVTAASSGNKDKARIKELEAEIASLRTSLKSGKGKASCKECPKKQAEIDGLKKAGEEAVERVGELEAEIKSLDDIIKIREARIKELEAQVEELTKPGGGQ